MTQFEYIKSLDVKQLAFYINSLYIRYQIYLMIEMCKHRNLEFTSYLPHPALTICKANPDSLNIYETIYEKSIEEIGELFFELYDAAKKKVQKTLCDKGFNINLVDLSPDIYIQDNINWLNSKLHKKEEK